MAGQLERVFRRCEPPVLGNVSYHNSHDEELKEMLETGYDPGEHTTRRDGGKEVAIAALREAGSKLSAICSKCLPDALRGSATSSLT